MGLKNSQIVTKILITVFKCCFAAETFQSKNVLRLKTKTRPNDDHKLQPGKETGADSRSPTLLPRFTLITWL